jgi:hypothetical protein
MTKRTIDGSSKSEKKVSITLFKALWINIGAFLTKDEHLNLFLSHYFSIIALNCLAHDYKRKYKYFPLSFLKVQQFSLDSLKTLNSERRLYDSHYYTVFNRRFIELFCLVEAGKSDEAKTFVEAELKSFLAGEKNYKKNNILDLLFCFDKNAVGETVINIAARKRLKDFLDYCFNRLILNIEVKPGKLVKPGRLTEILSQLNLKKMSAGALWLFACAYVCEQKELCDILSQMPSWQHTWLDPSSKKREPLTWMATCLGTLDLVKLVLKGEAPNSETMDLQTSTKKIYKLEEFPFLDNDMPVDCINMAAVSKNKEMVYYFLSLINIEEDDECFFGAELAFFLVEQKDFATLNRYYSPAIQDSSVKLSFYPPSQYNFDLRVMAAPRLLGYAVALNWQVGIHNLIQIGLSVAEGEILDPLYVAIEFRRLELAKYLLEQKADPNGYSDTEDERPIFRAVRKNNLDFVKLLVEHKASLDIKNEAQDVPQYPLIGAALNQNSTMVQYLLQSGSLDRLTASRQLSSTISFFTEKRSRIEQRILAKLYNDVNPFAIAPIP